MLCYTIMRGNSLQFLHSVHWKLTLPFWLHLKPCFMKGNSSRLSPQRPWQVQTARSQGRPRKTPEVDSIHQVFVFCHAMTVMVTTQRIQRQRHYGKDNSKDTKKKTTQRKRKKRQYDRWDTDHSSARDDGMFVQATSSSESSGQPEENDIWWGRLQWLWWRLKWLWWSCLHLCHFTKWNRDFHLLDIITTDLVERVRV